MVLIRKQVIIRRVKDITLGTTLTLALLGGTAALQSCDDRRGNETETTEYTKGVQTYLEETTKDEFKIVDEKTVEPSESKVFIKYLDGHSDTLNLDQARRLVDQQQASQQANNNNGNGGGYYNQGGMGLGNVLFYGGMGYLMGRSLSTPSNSRYYSNPGAFERSRQTTSTLSRAAKPSNSSRGFFGRGRSSSGGGRGFTG